MVRLTDIRSLTEFKRDTAAAVKQLRKTGRPQVLTVNGRAQVVVQDVAAYQRLLDAVDRAEAIEAIHEGLESMKHGEGRPADEVFAELRARYNVPAEE